MSGLETREVNFSYACLQYSQNITLFPSKFSVYFLSTFQKVFSPLFTGLVDLCL